VQWRWKKISIFTNKFVSFIYHLLNKSYSSRMTMPNYRCNRKKTILHFCTIYHYTVCLYPVASSNLETIWYSKCNARGKHAYVYSRISRSQLLSCKANFFLFLYNYLFLSERKDTINKWIHHCNKKISRVLRGEWQQVFANKFVLNDSRCALLCYVVFARLSTDGVRSKQLSSFRLMLND